VLRVQLVKLVIREQLVQQVLLEPDQRGQQDQSAHQVNRVGLDPLVGLDQRVQLDQLDPQEQPDLLEQLDQLEQQDLLDLQDHLVNKVFRVLKDQLVKGVNLDKVVGIIII
jgi:hypothetical protein